METEDYFSDYSICEKVVFAGNRTQAFSIYQKCCGHKTEAILDKLHGG